MNKLYQYIVENKLFFSGIAILGVILSHLLSADKENMLWYIFYPGFSGVDIFLLYSGYGLCRSYSNNTVANFYRHRFWRVYPMLVVFTIFLYGLTYLFHGLSFTTWDFISNITTLSFWGLGGIPAEWYLSFLIYLYLLFPLLYKVVKKFGIHILIVEFIGLFFFLFFYQHGWYFQCAASRIPIFTLGILLAQKNSVNTYKQGLILYAITFIIMLVLFAIRRVQKFELVYMLAPYIFTALAFIFQHTKEKCKWLYNTFCFLGKYSLEIYLANMLTVSFVHSIYPICNLPIAILYFALQFAITPILIGCNNVFKTLLKS